MIKTRLNIFFVFWANGAAKKGAHSINHKLPYESMTSSGVSLVLVTKPFMPSHAASASNLVSFR